MLVYRYSLLGTPTYNHICKASRWRFPYLRNFIESKTTLLPLPNWLPIFSAVRSKIVNRMLSKPWFSYKKQIHTPPFTFFSINKHLLEAKLSYLKSFRAITHDGSFFRCCYLFGVPAGSHQEIAPLWILGYIYHQYIPSIYSIFTINLPYLPSTIKKYPRHVSIFLPAWSAPGMLSPPWVPTDAGVQPDRLTKGATTGHGVPPWPSRNSYG